MVSALSAINRITSTIRLSLLLIVIVSGLKYISGTLYVAAPILTSRQGVDVGALTTKLHDLHTALAVLSRLIPTTNVAFLVLQLLHLSLYCVIFIILVLICFIVFLLLIIFFRLAMRTIA